MFGKAWAHPVNIIPIPLPCLFTKMPLRRRNTIKHKQPTLSRPYHYPHTNYKKISLSFSRRFFPSSSSCFLLKSLFPLLLQIPQLHSVTERNYSFHFLPHFPPLPNLSKHSLPNAFTISTHENSSWSRYGHPKTKKENMNSNLIRTKSFKIYFF